MKALNTVANKQAVAVVAREDLAIVNVTTYLSQGKVDLKVASECLAELSEAFPAKRISTEAINGKSSHEQLEKAFEGVISNIVNRFKSLFGSIEAKVALIEEKAKRLKALGDLRFKGELNLPGQKQFLRLMPNKKGVSKLDPAEIAELLEESAGTVRSIVQAMNSLAGDMDKFSKDNKDHPIGVIFKAFRGCYALPKPSDTRISSSMLMWAPALSPSNIVIDILEEGHFWFLPREIVLGEDKKVGYLPTQLPETFTVESPEKAFNSQTLDKFSKVGTEMVVASKSLSKFSDEFQLAATNSGFLGSYLRLAMVIEYNYLPRVDQTLNAYTTAYQLAAKQQSAPSA